MQLLLMKRGGQIIYAGPLGNQSHELVKYFEVSIETLLFSFITKVLDMSASYFEHCYVIMTYKFNGKNILYYFI